MEGARRLLQADTARLPDRGNDGRGAPRRVHDSCTPSRQYFRLDFYSRREDADMALAGATRGGFGLHFAEKSSARTRRRQRWPVADEADLIVNR